jgi:hypothetical protein
MPGTRHVYPTIGRCHDLSDSLDCWCHPALSVVCPACEGEPDPACWRCGGDSHTPARRDELGPHDVVVVFHRPLPGGARLGGDHLAPIEFRR